jgi:undecaprenyl-diphosphatase
MTSLDLVILKALYGAGFPPIGLKLVLGVSFLGSGWMMLPLAAGLLARRWRSLCASATVLLAVTSLAVASLKLATHRLRPCHALSWAHALPIDVPADYSFPSGHAAGSFAFAFFVWALSRRAGVPVVVLAILIAASRVVLGVHYPSDVTAGAVLGAALGLAAAVLHRRQAKHVTEATPQSAQS